MNKNIKRLKSALIIFAIFGASVFLVRTESVANWLFAIGLILGLIPTLALLGLTALTAYAALKLLELSNFMRVLFLALLVSQAVILSGWIAGWTAASAFDQSSFARGLPVIDPQLESTLMTAFWFGSAFIVAVMIEYLLSLINGSQLIPAGEYVFRNLLLVLVIEICLLLAVNSNMVNFRRTARSLNVPPGVSADGAKEVRLVPMKALFDTNGLVITRNSRSLLWTTAGPIGDRLTDATDGRFVWAPNGTQVYLLLNFAYEKDVPILGFDFKAQKQLDPKSYVHQE